jgi:hypothetical protein
MGRMYPAIKSKPERLPPYGVQMVALGLKI